MRHFKVILLLLLVAPLLLVVLLLLLHQRMLLLLLFVERQLPRPVLEKDKPRRGGAIESQQQPRIEQGPWRLKLDTSPLCLCLCLQRNAHTAP